MDASEEQLLQLFSQLAENPRSALLSYARYLVAEHGIEPAAEISKPLDITRPEGESVIKAIRRLSETYPMIEKSSMFDQTSALMMQHTLKGKPAPEVIDELEIVFRSRYEKLCESISADAAK